MKLCAAMLALLTACSGTSIYPGLYCTGRVQAEGATLSESFSAAAGELREKCAPTVNVKIKSWSGP